MTGITDLPCFQTIHFLFLSNNGFCDVKDAPRFVIVSFGIGKNSFIIFFLNFRLLDVPCCDLPLYIIKRQMSRKTAKLFAFLLIN